MSHDKYLIKDSDSEFVPLFLDIGMSKSKVNGTILPGRSVCQYASMSVSQYGSMSVWQYGSMSVWQYGIISVLQCVFMSVL